MLRISQERLPGVALGEAWKTPLGANPSSPEGYAGQDDTTCE